MDSTGSITARFKPGVAAALIVRDEGRFIRACLESLVGMVDDIVVIDTGSRDDTTAIVETFPARIGHFDWCGDFSAARNHAIAQVEHEWVLYIDADERLLVPDRAEFRNCLADGGKAAWKVRLHPRIGWTAYAELRLFRNDPRIRFEGEIHERVHGGVDRVCREDGLTVGLAGAGLQHVGYEDDQSPKLARNMPLLRTYLARDPGRIYCWWHLGEQYRVAGDAAAAREAWQGVEAVRRQPPEAATPSDVMPYTSLIISRYEAGLAVDDLLAEALDRFPDNHALAWVAGKLALERGALAAARQIFTRLAGIDAKNFFDEYVAYDRALFTHTAQESLGLTAFRAGDFAAATEHYRLAAQTAPDSEALRVKASLAAAKALRMAEQAGT
jgi:tetratricopeptide (TPR) repeat protein